MSAWSEPEMHDLAAQRADHRATARRGAHGPIGGPDRRRQGIGGVIGNAGQAHREQPLHHLRHLPLVGVAAAADRQLHLVRGRLVDGQPCLRRDEQRDAARLADGHRGLNVALEEEPLDRDHVGPVLADERAKSPVELHEPGPIGLGRCRPDDAGVDHAQPPALERHHTEAADGGAGVDAERDHAAILGARDQTTEASRASMRSAGMSKFA